jgi:hypothetical protein
MVRLTQFALPVLAAALLAGCGGSGTKEEAAALDDTLLGKGNSTDPALMAALEDQIMVDPGLTGQSNKHAVRPADQPLQSPIPPEQTGGTPPASDKTLGQVVAEKAKASEVATGSKTASAKTAQASFNGCGLDVQYAMAWSAKMPTDLPLYPQSRVAEAAGSDQGNCRLRAVTFSSTAEPRKVIDWYISTAQRAGYDAGLSTETGEQMVVGHRGDGAAFYMTIQQRDTGGTMADLVTNRGS